MDSKTLVNRKTRRTTLTLEADVADYVEHKLAVDQKLKEKNLINDLLRKGISADKSTKIPKFKIRGFKTKLLVSKRRLEEMLDEV
jgi:hypothetical protein